MLIRPIRPAFAQSRAMPMCVGETSSREEPRANHEHRSPEVAAQYVARPVHAFVDVREAVDEAKRSCGGPGGEPRPSSGHTFHDDRRTEKDKVGRTEDVPAGEALAGE